MAAIIEIGFFVLLAAIWALLVIAFDDPRPDTLDWRFRRLSHDHR
jgi:hypothetical protein